MRFERIRRRSTRGRPPPDVAARELPTERTRLLDNLGRIRREVGPVTAELSDALADHMNIRRGEVHEVKSFYSFLEVPVDALRVCTGPVCDCLGARELLARTQEHAPPGASVVEVPCLGHCELAPVATRGDAILPFGRDEQVTHRTNDGASLGLAHRDETLPTTSAAVASRCCARRLERGDPRRATRVRVVRVRRRRLPDGDEVGGDRREPGPRYVVVNADEGEPGTIKDRYVMELRPHLMLEATVLAMRFAEASEGFIYLREEYATARHRLARAIEEFRTRGSSKGCRSSSSSARGRTSAARRRRCSSRWKAGAGCRG